MSRQENPTPAETLPETAAQTPENPPAETPAPEGAADTPPQDGQEPQAPAASADSADLFKVYEQYRTAAEAGDETGMEAAVSPAAVEAAISDRLVVAARVLVDGAYGSANSVVFVPPQEAAASSELDPSPEAVAYAESLGHA